MEPNGRTGAGRVRCTRCCGRGASSQQGLGNSKGKLHLDNQYGELYFLKCKQGVGTDNLSIFQSEGILMLWEGQAYQLESPVGVQKTKPTLTLGPGAQSTPGCQGSNLLSF